MTVSRVTVRVRAHGRVHKKTMTRKVKQTEATTLSMPTEFVGQNGAVIHQTTPVSVTECGKAKAVKHAKKAAKKRKRGK